MHEGFQSQNWERSRMCYLFAQKMEMSYCSPDKIMTYASMTKSLVHQMQMEAVIGNALGSTLLGGQ